MEKEEVESKIKELSVFCCNGINVDTLLRPISEKVALFDFLTAAEEAAKLLEEGGTANA